MKGDPGARKDFFALLDRHGVGGEVSRELRDLLAEDEEFSPISSLRSGAVDGRRPWAGKSEGQANAPSDERILQAFLRNDFRAFSEKVFATLSPGQTFVRSWHLEAIARALERVRRGETKRLIINMPPRSLKSTMASVAFPAFVLGHDPTQRIISASYSAELANKLSNDSRTIFNLPWYKELFRKRGLGNTKILRLRSSLQGAASVWRPRSAVL